MPGLELSRRFHDEVVAPVLAERLPGLRYSAARLDSGSELFGFDTPRSTDHDWGPRLQIFLNRDGEQLRERIGEVLAEKLPDTFLGYPTRFAGQRTGLGVLSADGDRHGVTVVELGAWFSTTLGFDPRAGVTLADWLATPTQRLAEVTAGAVFHDGLDGALTRARRRLTWYPDDVWRYVLASQWARIGQDEHFVGRCGEVGDELGSTLVAARLARDLMRLCLLLARRYPPYSKWLGTAFARVPEVAPVADALTAALAATTWQVREAHLCRAYETVAVRTNDAGLAPPLNPAVRRFHDRPFHVLDAGRFAENLRARIIDPRVRGLPLIGAIDQFVDNTEVLARVGRFRSAATALLQQ